jgi:hypothetical protein
MTIRGYNSYPFQGFGRGLNLLDKPDAVDPAECVDCMDVTFSDVGAIEQRAGCGKATPTPLTNRVDSLEPFYTASGTKQLLAGCGTRLEALNTSLEVVASETGLTGGPYGFVRFGSPNEETAYAGNGTDTIRKWNGAAWSTPVAKVDGEASKAMPKARYLCVQSPDNRLVATGFSTTTGGPNGAISSPSTVWFSEDGKPEEWMTAGTAGHPNNSVQLTPGDGEKITGAIAWKEFTFVFKETKFFVFKGNSTDGEGNPVFNYARVENGIGCVAPRTICADLNGVYFMGREGIYRTTGQSPELLSRIIEPIWTSDPSAFYTGGVIAHGSITACAATMHEEQLYLSFPTAEANSRTLVFDPRAEWWSLYSLPCSALASFRVGSRAELVFGYASGTNDVGRHGPAFTNDAGAAIQSRWRSGWFDLNSPDVKTNRGTKVWGSGKVSISVGKDFQQGRGALDTLEFTPPGTKWNVEHWNTSTWGTQSALLGKERRRAVRGTVFSVYLENSILNQKFSVHRMDHMLRETMKPSTVEA